MARPRPLWPLPRAGQPPLADRAPEPAPVINPRSRSLMFVSLILAASLVTRPVASVQPNPADIETCLACHGDRSLEVALPSGEVRSLYADAEQYRASVHGDKLACTDCHQDITAVPHESRPFKTLREFTVAYYEQCKRCHFDNYTKTLDSVHYASLARGDRTAPLCVDCHGAHNIRRPNQPRTRVSDTCARCHAGVSDVYAKSVHGRLAGENADVPVCTDCHRSHDVAGPQDELWHKRTPELCANCHSNKTLMDKYGLSSNVMTTYVADFHGMTASLQRSDATHDSSVVALCTDCHGVHDILKADEPGSRVLKANLVKTCARCHEGATGNFPAAWMSHYEPSWRTAPLVYGVQAFYNVLIPFMIGGLILQVLLHLWRVVVNR
ncbi:MAG: cytochrome c3 family protein [Acidobacteriota bacterium]